MMCCASTSAQGKEGKSKGTKNDQGLSAPYIFLEKKGKIIIPLTIPATLISLSPNALQKKFSHRCKPRLLLRFNTPRAILLSVGGGRCCGIAKGCPGPVSHCSCLASHLQYVHEHDHRDRDRDRDTRTDARIHPHMHMHAHNTQGGERAVDPLAPHLTAIRAGARRRGAPNTARWRGRSPKHTYRGYSSLE